MSDSNKAASETKRTHRLLPHLAIPAALALLSVGLTGCFRISSDAQALRDSVMKSASGEWDEEIEIGVGALTLNLARAGLAFVSLEPEARAALAAARGAEVGVYRLQKQRRRLDHATMLAKADQAMSRRGWDRVVGVMNEREFVAVYVPNHVRSTRNVKICVVVMDGQELVVASARGNLEPLMEIAFSRAPWRLVGGSQ